MYGINEPKDAPRQTAASSFATPVGLVLRGESINDPKKFVECYTKYIRRSNFSKSYCCNFKSKKGGKNRNRYNHVPHLINQNITTFLLTCRRDSIFYISRHTPSSTPIVSLVFTCQRTLPPPPQMTLKYIISVN